VTLVHPEPAADWQVPATGRRDESRPACLLEFNDRTWVVLLPLSGFEREALAVALCQERQRQRRHVDVPRHVADVVACAFVHDRARLLERAARGSLQEERGQPLLSIAYLLAIALKDVAKRQPAFAGYLHEQKVRYEDGRGGATAAALHARAVRAKDATERLLVALLGDDRSEVALKGFNVRAGALEETVEASPWSLV